MCGRYNHFLFHNCLGISNHRLSGGCLTANTILLRRRCVARKLFLFFVFLHTTVHFAQVDVISKLLISRGGGWDKKKTDDN